MRGRARWLWIAATAAAAACRSAPPLQFETAYIPVGEVCDRVHQVMRDNDEGRIYLDLPAAADMVVMATRASGSASDCGDELFAWLRDQVGARPIDLRPRLEARILALGTLAAADNPWTEPAVKLLGSLLIDDGKPIVHAYEEKQMVDMGSLSIQGWREAVTLDALDHWVVEALRRGFVSKIPRPQQYPGSLGDWYADFLARLFAARYTAPPSRLQTGFHANPLAEPKRSPPPDPTRLGCGTAPLDGMWPDLVRTFRASPTHDRWDTLPAAVINRLRHPEDAPPCGG